MIYVEVRKMESGGRRPMGDPVSSQVGGRLQRHQSGCTYPTGDVTHIAIAQRVALPAVTQRPPFGWLSSILVRLPIVHIIFCLYAK